MTLTDFVSPSIQMIISVITILVALQWRDVFSEMIKQTIPRVDDKWRMVLHALVALVVTAIAVVFIYFINRFSNNGTSD